MKKEQQEQLKRVREQLDALRAWENETGDLITTSPPARLKSIATVEARRSPSTLRFEVIGVNRATGDDVVHVVDAFTPGNAKAKTELKGVMVTEVRTLASSPVKTETPPERTSSSISTFGRFLAIWLGVGACCLLYAVVRVSGTQLSGGEAFGYVIGATLVASLPVTAVLWGLTSQLSAVALRAAWICGFLLAIGGGSIAILHEPASFIRHVTTGFIIGAGIPLLIGWIVSAGER